MIRHTAFYFIALVIVLTACASIKYADDAAFTASAWGNSPEFPVWVNGKLCVDTDGIPGMCSKRVKANEPLTYRLEARPYAYTLRVACPKEMGESFGVDVEAGKPFDHTITPDKYPTARSFVCIGEIFPQDRGEPISAKWEFRAKVVDPNYTMRETPYIAKKGKRSFLIAGQYARSVDVYDQGEWKHHDRAPVVEIKGDPEKVLAFSESFVMRFNSYGVRP